MKAIVRGAAALLTTAIALTSAAAIAQDKTVLTTEREKNSYMVGADVARSIGPIAADMDIAAFRRSIENVFATGKSLLPEAETPAVGQALMARIAARNGQAPEGAAVPDVSKEKVGYLVGGDVGRSLAPIKAELDVAVLVQAVRTSLAKEPLLLSEAELVAIGKAFGEKMQAADQQRQSQAQQAAAAVGARNREEGPAFLATNKSQKGVFSTPSGLQYMVLRQGSGARPTINDRVRVHYKGTLLDGTEFDSSYGRGQPTEFGLGQVIAGWTEGLGLMPVGGKYRFWIPSELAYGPRGTPGGPIGPDATLVFDVELLEIVQ